MMHQDQMAHFLYEAAITPLSFSILSFLWLLPTARSGAPHVEAYLAVVVRSTPHLQAQGQPFRFDLSDTEDPSSSMAYAPARGQIGQEIPQLPEHVRGCTRIGLAVRRSDHFQHAA